MGMFNAIIPDDLLNPPGVFKERLSPVGPVCDDARGSRRGGARRLRLDGRTGMKFHFGKNPKTELTVEQILEQCKMYIAAAAHRRRFRLRRHRHPVSAGAEGPDARKRPGRGDAQQRRSAAGHRAATASRSAPGRRSPTSTKSTSAPASTPCITYRVHRALGQPVENTLHDMRWGDADRSGNGQRLCVGVPDLRRRAAGAFHRRLGGRRQPAPASDVFPPRRRNAARRRKPGEIVWSRIFVEDGQAQDGLRPGRGRGAAATRRRSAAGGTRRRNGRSCTPCCMASRATR